MMVYYGFLYRHIQLCSIILVILHVWQNYFMMRQLPSITHVFHSCHWYMVHGRVYACKLLQLPVLSQPCKPQQPRTLKRRGCSTWPMRISITNTGDYYVVYVDTYLIWLYIYIYTKYATIWDRRPRLRFTPNKWPLFNFGETHHTLWDLIQIYAPCLPKKTNAYLAKDQRHRGTAHLGIIVVHQQLELLPSLFSQYKGVAIACPGTSNTESHRGRWGSELVRC